MSFLRFAAVSFFGLAAATAATAQFAVQSPATVTSPAPAAGAPSASTVLPQRQDQAPAFRKATKEEVAAALRSDPLTQSAFFANQYDHDPTDVQMGLYLSNALRALGRYPEAADTAQKALLFAPDNVDILTAAARAEIAANQGFYAVQPLQHAIELRASDWQLYSLLGVAYDQIKRGDDAQAAWQTALKLSPDNATVLTNIAMSKVTQGDFEGAEPLLRTAAAQKDATLQIRQNLALVLGLEGKMGEAEKLLRQDLPPDQADANLAWLQARLAERQPAAATAASDAPSRSWDSLKQSGG